MKASPKAMWTPFSIKFSKCQSHTAVQGKLSYDGEIVIMPQIAGRSRQPILVAYPWA